MRRAINIIPVDERKDNNIISTVTLSYQDRHRRRIKMQDDTGEMFLLDLPEAVQMEEDDALVLKEGGIIVVKAAEEDVLDIRCKTANKMTRIAWHIGNRHTPVQVLGDGALRIMYDHVLKAMVEGLGGEVKRNVAIFSPEQGAYDSSEHKDRHAHVYQ